MKAEVERKFLVRTMPDLTGIEVEEQERYFIEIGETEKRITKAGDKYIYEEKTKGVGMFPEKEWGIISKEEFEKLKSLAIKGLVRKCYFLSRDPEVSIKIYSGDYEGLARAEFEFKNENEAKNFAPPEWVGNEITTTVIGRDGRLIDLSREEFLDLLRSFN